MKRRWLPGLVEVLGPPLVGLLHLTLRIRRVPFERVEDDRDGPALRGPRIYAFWHQAQLLPAWTHRRLGIGILVSRHGDGELISRVVRRLGFRPVRGSSSRGGAPALKRMIREVETGHDVAFTPDGPRGPRYRVQAGIIQAASLSGIPIRPVVYGIDRVKRLRSWDRFLIPKPFGHAVMRFGPLLHVPPDLDRDARESHRQRLERIMRDLQARAWREVRSRRRVSTTRDRG